MIHHHPTGHTAALPSPLTTCTESTILLTTQAWFGTILTL